MAPPLLHALPLLLLPVCSGQPTPPIDQCSICHALTDCNCGFYEWGSTVLLVAMAQPWLIAFVLLLWIQQLRKQLAVQSKGTAKPYDVGDEELRNPLLPERKGNQPEPKEGNVLVQVSMTATGKAYHLELSPAMWRNFHDAIASKDWNTLLPVICETDPPREYHVHGILLRRELERLSDRGHAIDRDELFDVVVQTDLGDLIRKGDPLFLTRLSKLQSKYNTSPDVDMTCLTPPHLQLSTRKCVVDA
eukprot:Sspe_Gene.94073::Locus_66543_Transcript_1_1_Confidence_1.000_Length_789::g.94073::m.94073